jgi:hypothetical protein
MASFNKDKPGNPEIDLIARGEFIFSDKEKDKRSAGAFYVVLLDSIEKWAMAHPVTPEDWKSPSQFYKLYSSL